MPTAAKLFSAFMFALIGLGAAWGVLPVLPEAMSVGMLLPVSAGLGALTGWFVMGGLVGRSVLVSAGQGLRTSATLLFWVLVVAGIVEMLRRSLRKSYGDAAEAVISVLEIMLDFLMMAVQSPTTLVILGVGGLVAGALAELVSRRWP
ncbi:MAG: hypothetical protein CVT80_11345 [Alphaproteobacteria bacterium HGW-Alphaproteobacteria-2]|nr:MAG: hypothetical protein CVT80_11345 [Alphaproteobacteria bacterium HGW-Alphaproteobacteria-2]